jgi:hypothetical protein
MIGMTLMEEYLDNSISLAKIENAFEGLNKRIERRVQGTKAYTRVLVEMDLFLITREIYWTQSQVRMKLPLRLLMQ